MKICIQHTHTLHFKLFLCSVILMAAIPGCGSQPDAVSLLVSGDTAGWITPCGCASNQSGGLARRATILRDAGRNNSVMYVDAGGTAIGTGEYQTLKLQSLLRGMTQMGLLVHNVGGPETEFSLQQLNQFSKDTGVQWLSTNLASTVAGEPNTVIDFLEIEQLGCKFLVLGVVDPELSNTELWQVKDPLQSILAGLERYSSVHQRRPDATVVLAYLAEDKLKAIAESLPEVDVVVGGPTGQVLNPVKVGSGTVLSATNKGKFLAQIDWRKNGTGNKLVRSESIVEVSSGLQEHEKQLANLRDYYLRLEKRDFSSEESGLVAASSRHAEGYSVAGSEACIKCHQGDDQVWHNSKHSHAFDVLVTKGAQFDPHCQQCHTTGYGLDGGFLKVSESRNRFHVGCENCHGPSQAHVVDPKVRTPFLAKEQCIRCHDHENSPEFHFETYWSNKVAHSGMKL